MRRANYPLDQFSADYIKAALDTCKGKVKRFVELGPYAGFYFAEEVRIDSAAAAKEFTAENLARLKKLRDAFAQSDEFIALKLEQTLKAVAVELGVKAGALVHPARVACTGNTAGPSLYHLLEILGKENVLKRIDRTLGLASS